MDDQDAEDAGELAELEDFGGDDLPPPPPPPAPTQGGRPNTPPTPPSAEFLELATRIRSSTNRIEKGAIAFDVLSASMADVLEDRSLTPADRRRELRTIAAAAAKVLPIKELHEATQKVDGYLAQIDTRKRARAGAELERRSVALERPRGKVIPIRGSAVPDGGKPH